MSTPVFGPLLIAGLLSPLAFGLLPLAAAPPNREAHAVLEDARGGVESVPLARWSVAEGEPLGAVSVRFRGLDRAAAPVPSEERVAVELLGGERLEGRLAGGLDQDLLVEVAGGARLALALGSLYSVRFPERLPAGSAGRVEPAAEEDRLYLRVGNRLDRVDGALDGFDARGLVFVGLAGRREHRWEEVAAFFVAPLGSAPPPPPGGGTPVEVDLVGGGRLAGALVGAGPGGLRLATRGGPLELPLVAVLELSVADGRLAHLGDLEPALSQGGQPFGDDLGMVWPPRRDRAVHGEALRAGDQVHPRGLGVLAPARQEWELDPSWEAFAAEVAVDDSVLKLSARGSVVFRIELDGREVWQSGLVRGGQSPRSVPRIELGEARRLALVVDDGGDGFVGDRANWLRPRLLRERAPGGAGDRAR